MVPVPILSRKAHSSRLLYALVNLVSYYVPHLLHRDSSHDALLIPRAQSGSPSKHNIRDIIFAILIPVLVLLSGLFAGLTLGYMSLDETQLNVLSVSGTATQRMYANKIKPIRKNGHLLLVTLLLANMIVNETLPIISDPVLGGGVQSVVVSTILIVIFSEIIPQSVCTRHGLYLGAKMAGFTQILIYGMGIVAWPVAKLLEFVLGPHHGIIYRRGELKELIAMHSAHAAHGGDLKLDTVTIIGATLDLQEKVVKQAMTPIDDVFMLSIDSRLDYDLLNKICGTGHSRVPVYEEIDVPVYTTSDTTGGNERTRRVKRILGILLVKNCVLLDPKDATPLRKIPLNKVPFVPNNEPLLRILDRFQEGRSHMAIVSRFSVDEAASVKQAVKRGLTQRLLDKVGIGDSDDSPPELSDDSAGTGSEGIRLRAKYGFRRKKRNRTKVSQDTSSDDGETTLKTRETTFDNARVLETGDVTKNATQDMELEEPTERMKEDEPNAVSEPSTAAKKRTALTRPLKTMTGIGMMSMPQLEQSMPADAILSKEAAAEFMKNFDPAVAPLGIITLEDVLEELIGEEIYDEFDAQGAHGDLWEVPHIQVTSEKSDQGPGAVASTSGVADLQMIVSPPLVNAPAPVTSSRVSFGGLHIPKPLKALDIFALRSHSAPPVQRETEGQADGHMKSEALAAGDNIALITNSEPLNAPEAATKGRMQSASPREVHEEILAAGGLTGPVAEDNVMSARLIGESVKSRGSPASGTPSGQKPFGISTSASGAAGTLSPSSRSASPGPPLEAVLLERKRRLGMAIGSSAGTDTRPPGIRPSTSAGPGSSSGGRIAPVASNGSSSRVKGTRFKSSRLGAIEPVGTSEPSVAAVTAEELANTVNEPLSGDSDKV